MSKPMFQYYLNHPNIEWTCDCCALPNFTDSFFTEDAQTVEDELADPAVFIAEKNGDTVPDRYESSSCWYETNISSYYKSNIKIAHLNINAVYNKLDEVKEMLNMKMFDILFLAETKIDNTVTDAFLNHPGFRLIRRDRKKGAGGLIAYVREDMSVYRRRKLEPENIESICLDVKDSKNARFLVCACYRSPSKCKEVDFITSLSSAIEEMYRSRNELLLLGDFNMDMYVNKEANRAPNKNLTHLCQRYCLANQISEPTRVTVNSNTLIDVILASHQDRYVTSGILHLGLSDHELIFIVRKNKIPRPKPRDIVYRSLKNLDEELFLRDLKNVPWHTAFLYNNADDVWYHWSKLYKEILDQHVPLKKKQVRADQLPWISPRILREIAFRNRLYKRHKRKPGTSTWEAYKKQRNKVTWMKRQGMKAFCSDASTNAKNHGEFWKKMRPLLPNTGSKKSNGFILIENESIITEPKQIAETFNKYFAEVANNSENDKRLDEYSDHPSIRSITEKDLIQDFKFEPVNTEYIRKVLNEIDPRKAVGVDDISPRLLKLSAPALAEEVTRLINYFITINCWPLEWKSCNITPVYKKADETTKTNYRPVSVLSALSKVYEKVMYDQIYSAVCPHLSTNLSGFLKGHSCCTAMLKMTDDWRSDLDNRKSVATIAVDLSKAFDSVCHNLLLAKLKAYGLSESALELMKAYLTYERRQRVKINGVCSEWKTVKVGLPQGSLLGPLLFNVFVNDINYFNASMSLRLYADDTTGYYADHSPMVLEYTINNEMSTLAEWFASNYLLINATKTQALSIGPSTYSYIFELNDTQIEMNDSLKILGLTIDPMLTFKDHIKEQLKRAYAKAGALRRIRRFVPPDIMSQLYKAFVLPHLEYCGPVLVGIAKTQSNKLEDANFYILRSIFGLAKSFTYERALQLVKIRTLQYRRYYQSLVLLFKCMKEQGPSYIQKFFKLRLSHYNLRGSGTKLEQRRFNTNWLKKSYSYITSHLWNNLPDNVRTAPDTKSFTRMLNKVELSPYLYTS